MPSSRYPKSVEPLESRRHLTSTVNGTVFNDANGDGYHEYNEGPLVHYPIRGDTNRDGVLDASDPIVYTDANGAFSFTGLANGGKQFNVAPVTPAGYVGGTVVSSGYALPNYDITYESPDVFSATTKSVIVGSIIRDANGNARNDYPDDDGLAGQVVYVDSNLNGQRDPGEPSTVTGYSGIYQLGVDVPPAPDGAVGSQTFRVVLDPGADVTPDPDNGAVQATVASHQRVNVGSLFVHAPVGSQLQISGPNAINRIGDASVTSVRQGGTLALTAYVNSRTGQDTVEWDAHYTPGGDFTAEASGTSYAFADDASQGGRTSIYVAERVRTASGVGPVRVVRVDVRPATPTGSISGATFNDLDGDGVFNGNDAYVGGKTVYLDTNNNGKLDPGETSVVTDDLANYKFTGLADGLYHVRRVFPSGYRQSTPTLDITIVDGQPNPRADIGSTLINPPPVAGTMTGFAFDDTNKDGTYETGEAKTAGKVVFLDTNNNGKLDSGETSTKTAADGSFKFTNLAAGTYHLRRVFPSGYTYSTALSDITISAGQPSSGPYAIGSKTNVVVPPPATGTASLAGTLFNDNNANAKYDSGDRGTVAARVFLDSNNNGVLDTGELFTDTDTVGKFLFQNLAAGTYHVRRVFASGQSYSTPPVDVTVTNGQAKTGLLIGTKKA